MSSIVTQPHGSHAVRHDPFLTPLQQQAVNGYLRLKEEADRRGWTPASLISLHPFTWPVTGPIHQCDIRIPNVPLDKDLWLASPKLKTAAGLEVPYVQHIFPQWKPLQQKYLLGQIDFEEVNDSGHIWPIDQANDAVHQNGLGADRGGVFSYEGTHQPGAEKDKAQAELAQFETAHAVQMNYYVEQYEKFSDAYMSRQTTNSWRDMVGKGKFHRWIAMYLYRIGSIKELPAWYQEIAQAGGKAADKCDQCKQNVEPGSVVCRHCNRVLNPFEAFAKLMIDADTPGAKLAAKRLTPAEVKTLVEGGRLSEEQAEQWGLEHKGKGKAKS